MDDQETIFVRYPDAEARNNPLILKHGEDKPIQEACWCIHAGPGCDAAELGRGHTEAAAWANAAAMLNRPAAETAVTARLPAA
jgi:hypothetical protein